ncbi:MAG: cysteine desulfurase [Spirochaetes bacterium]|nr:cysteine desulfurase [Spirochaetota bacterium]
MYTLKTGSFPLLEANPNLIYLDNASTTQKPEPVLQAITQYYQTRNANVHRAVYRLAEASTHAYEGARDRIARFIGAASSKEIVFTRGTTEALNLIAHSLARTVLHPGDIIIVTQMDHHSNIVPFWLAAQELGLHLRFWPITPSGELDLEDLERIWSDRVRVVTLPHVSNVLGTVNPIPTIASFVHDRGALLVLDAAQSVGHGPFHVSELGCDMAAFSGHKMYGPMGIGILWARERILNSLVPYQGGGEMIASVSETYVTFNEPPYRFEAGTPNVEGAVGLAAAMDFLDTLDRERIWAEEQELARYGVEILSSVKDLTLYGKSSSRAALFTFNLKGIHSHDLAQFLDSRSIAVRSGHHCAQPLFQRLGVPSAVRASLGIYNRKEDLDRLADALEEARRYFHE